MCLVVHAFFKIAVPLVPNSMTKLLSVGSIIIFEYIYIYRCYSTLVAVLTMPFPLQSIMMVSKLVVFLIEANLLFSSDLQNSNWFLLWRQKWMLYYIMWPGSCFFTLMGENTIRLASSICSCKINIWSCSCLAVWLSLVPLSPAWCEKLRMICHNSDLSQLQN